VCCSCCPSCPCHHLHRRPRPCSRHCPYLHRCVAAVAITVAIVVVVVVVAIAIALLCCCHCHCHCQRVVVVVVVVFYHRQWRERGEGECGRRGVVRWEGKSYHVELNSHAVALQISGKPQARTMRQWRTRKLNLENSLSRMSFQPQSATAAVAVACLRGYLL
jgi:hypothetical protein